MALGCESVQLMLPETLPYPISRILSSSCGSITEQISEYLDHHINPLVSFTRSYVKDTNHVLAKLGKLGSIPDGAILCTVDVVGLYPSIPHGEGLGL